ncbi:MAG: hypothetical protein WC526_03510 [Patescibacteria group bacterium]
MTKIIAFFIGTISLLTNFFAPISPISPVSQSAANSTLNLQNLNNLPVTMEQHPATSSWATAIVLPQSHRYPGSEIADPKNNNAVVVQNQIYNVISQLYNQNHINFVLAEGDLNGPVPADKISNLNQEIKLRNQFAEESSNLNKILSQNNSANQTCLTGFFNQTNKIISYLDRDIALAGAPYQLKAEGNDLALYGAENSSTREASANIVRDYVYLNDRLTQLGGGSQLASASVSGASTNASMLALLSTLGGQKSQPLESYFPSLVTIAGTDAAASTAVNQLKDTYHQLQTLDKVKNASEASASSPSRADNPYSSITDTTQIRTLISKNNDQLTDVVLNQRNEDAADNFAQNLKSQNLDTGIIIFGAEHTAGLIKDLNDKGISVITISVQGLATTQTSS